MSRIALGMALALSACAAGAGDDTDVEIVTLEHRTAADIAPILAPLAAPDTVVTGTGDRLILRGPAARRAELKRVVGELDRAPRRLLVTVRQEHGAAAQGRSTELAAHYRTGAEDDAAVTLRALRTHASADDHGEQTVQALEGRPAFVAIGQSVPVADRSVHLYGGHAVVQDSVRYRDVTRGFWVVPRLSGDRVTLELHPRHERLDARGGGTVALGAAATSVSGRLGEWLQVAGGNEDVHLGEDALLAHTRRTARSSYAVWVKVEELP